MVKWSNVSVSCVKIGKSATKTPEMLPEVFEECYLCQTAVFEWHSRFKDSYQMKMMNFLGDQATAKQQKMLKKFKNSSTEHSMSLQTLLGSVMEFARRSLLKI
jgi:hypothetical protein